MLHTSVRNTTSAAIIMVVIVLMLIFQQDTRSFKNVVPGSYIVQAASLDLALGAVHSVGGEITHELGIINAVGALLTDAQLDALDDAQQIRTYDNRTNLVVSGASSSELDFFKGCGC